MKVAVFHWFSKVRAFTLVEFPDLCHGFENKHSKQRGWLVSSSEEYAKINRDLAYARRCKQHTWHRLRVFSSPWHWLHVCQNRRAWHRVNIFPRLAPGEYFPALGTGWLFSRAWHRLSIFPRLAPVACILLSWFCLALSLFVVVALKFVWVIFFGLFW